MERRTHSTKEDGACVVCGANDRRLLTTAELVGGASVALCGSHALLYRRLAPAKSLGELRAALADRRETDRRRFFGGDELGDRLVAAFTRDRRSAERRA